MMASNDLEQQLMCDEHESEINALQAWKEIHSSLLRAVQEAQEAVRIQKIQKRYWLEELAFNLTDSGKLVFHSVWKKPVVMKTASVPTKGSNKRPSNTLATKKKEKATKRKKKDESSASAKKGNTNKLANRKPAAAKKARIKKEERSSSPQPQDSSPSSYQNEEEQDEDDDEEVEEEHEEDDERAYDEQPPRFPRPQHPHHYPDYQHSSAWGPPNVPSAHQQSMQMMVRC
jgi:hypothetical protein